MDDSEGYERDELDDIIDGSDDTDTSLSRSTASSIASSMFDRQHFVLELHELQKAEPVLEKPQDSKFKKLKKKINGPADRRSKSSESSETDDDSLSPSITDEITKEQFFDAHESYYGFPENTMGSVDETMIQEFEKLRGLKLFLERPKPERRCRTPLMEDLKPIREHIVDRRNLSPSAEVEPKDIKESSLECSGPLSSTEVTEVKQLNEQTIDKPSLQTSAPFTEPNQLKEQSIKPPSRPSSERHGVENIHTPLKKKNMEL
ncbi:uncharacterized protein [Battus philenor]|uniref:uncharacterized protein n=1 Tax=Battus philenor TaxID=42288 RepID=UPI0035CF435C